MWMYILYIFLGICTLVYIISAIEIIGSYRLTYEKQHLKDLKEFLILPLVFPPLAPIAAYTLYSNALEYYEKKWPNKHNNEESFFCYLKYHKMSIQEWYDYNKAKSKIVPLHAKKQTGKVH